MSLVILSNQLEVSEENTDSEWEKPYSFHNALKETLKIPANSEVALQSIKVNKENTLSLDGSQTFYMTYGDDLNADAKEIEDTTQIPIMTTIKPVSDYNEDVSKEVFVARVGDALNFGMPLPDFYGEQTATLKLDANNLFDGFNLNMTGLGDMGDTSSIPSTDKWKSNYTAEEADDGSLVMTVSGSNIRGSVRPTPAHRDTQVLEAVMVGEDTPLSHYNGEVRFDLDGLFKYGSGNGFEIQTDVAMGLMRTNKATANSDPSYFDDSGDGLPTFEGIGNLQFYDYVIRIEQGRTPSGYKLWVGQSAFGANAEGPDQEVDYQMREIEYYGWATDDGTKPEAPFQAGLYDMGTNASKINQFKIQIAGEKVIFWYHTGTKDTLTTGAGDYNNSYGGTYGEWKQLCSIDQATEAEWNTLYDGSDPTEIKSYRQHTPKPISSATYNLYPAIYINATSANGPSAYYMEVSKWGGRTGDDRIKINSSTTDLVQRLREKGEEGQLYDLEGRYMFRMGGGEVSTPDKFYEQRSAFTKRKLTDFSYNIMLEDGTKYKPTPFANARDILGFSVDLLSTTAKPPTNVGNVYTYSSDVSPLTDSQTNLFVRLNNFTQRSYNAGIGRPSKIIYTLPRFDMSGREVGSGLYYEPGERVYLALGNTEDLYINEFDISIVDSRERLARVLKGTTIITLHFRESSTIKSRT